MPAQGLAGPGHHQRADRIVVAGASVGVDQLFGHLHGEGVELRRPVEGEREHAPIDLQV